MTPEETLRQIKDLRKRLTFSSDVIYFYNLSQPEPDKEITILAGAMANVASALAKTLAGMDSERAMDQLLSHYEKLERKHNESD